MKILNYLILVQITFVSTVCAQDASPLAPGETTASQETSTTAVTDDSGKITEDSWDASPQNWKNSKHNFENARFNFANSPKNYFNKESNPSRINILNVFNVVVGYAVKKADGGINYFDNDGERIGYSPDGGKSQFDTDGDSTEFKIEEK